MMGTFGSPSAFSKLEKLKVIHNSQLKITESVHHQKESVKLDHQIHNKRRYRLTRGVGQTLFHRSGSIQPL